MRYRSTTAPETPVSVPRRVRNRSSCTSAWGAWSVVSTTTWSPSSLKKEIWDVEIGGFNALRKKCGTTMLPINPVTIRTTSVERLPGGTGQHLVSNTPNCWRTETVSDAPNWIGEALWLVDVPPEDYNLIAAAKLAAISQLRASTYDALTDLVEIRKSADLFRQLSSKMDGFLNRCIELTRSEIYRRRLKRKVKYTTVGEALSAFQKIASEEWLKYRYGVKPIVYSLRDSLESIRAQKGGIIRAKASRSENISDTQSLTWAVSADTVGTTVQTITGTRVYRATAYGRVDIQGLGSFDPVVTAWETMKWSWLLDWLIDIGAYLQAISPFSQVSILGVSISVKTIAEKRQSFGYEWVNVSPTNLHSGSTGNSQTIITTQEYSRYADTPSVPWPRWNPRLNLPRITDLLAIAIQLKTGLNDKLLRI